MPKITRESLMTLEAYSRQRTIFRAEVMAHKQLRKARLGKNVTILFEDELTIRYQIQEMLRAERIFEDGRIQDELDSYNPLVPDGTNLKATMLLEYPDPEERRILLQRLVGIQDRVWIKVEGNEKSWAIADEDIERENDEKTSAVHFLRFELTESMIRALKAEASLAVGIDHPSYTESTELSVDSSMNLAKDLN